MNPWAIIGAGVAVLLLCAGVGRASYTAGRNAELRAQQEGNRKAQDRATEADKLYRATVTERDDAMKVLDELLAQPPPEPQILVRRIPSDAPNCTCDDRSDDYWLHYNAAATGSRPEGPAPALPRPAQGDAAVHPP